VCGQMKQIGKFRHLLVPDKFTDTNFFTIFFIVVDVTYYNWVHNKK
jgi:hypothetical protein